MLAVAVDLSAATTASAEKSAAPLADSAAKSAALAAKSAAFAAVPLEELEKLLHHARPGGLLQQAHIILQLN